MTKFHSLLNKSKEFYQDYKEVFLFILRVIIIYLVWKFLIWFLGEEKVPIDERYWPWLSNLWEQFNDFVRIILLNVTHFIFDLLGYQTAIINNYRLYVPGYATLGVGNYCLAIQLWLFFAALIFSYPGKFLNKLWFSIVGIISINIINIIRFIIIVFAAHYYPEHIKFNHDYVFNVVVYIFTFLMWVWWVKKISPNPKTNSNKKIWVWFKKNGSSEIE